MESEPLSMHTDNVLERLLSGMSLSETANIHQINNAIRNLLPRNFDNDGLKFDHTEESNAMPFLLALQNFGEHMKKLDIRFSFGDWNNHNHKILQLMAKKCDSLIDLAVSGINDISIRLPLPSVQKLTFYDSTYCMNSSWDNISQFFPNVQSFELKSMRNLKETFVKHVPSLDHFGYCSPRLAKQGPNDLLAIAHFINANPQLTSLNLDLIDDGPQQLQLQSTINWTALNISKMNLSAETLHLHNIVQLRKLKSLKVSASQYKMSAMGTMENRTIRELEIDVYFRDYSILNFIVSCQRLQKLKMNLYTSMEFLYIKQLAKYLPHLREITFHVHTNVYENESDIVDGLFEFMAISKIRMAHVYQSINFGSIQIDRCSKQVRLYGELYEKSLARFNNVNWKMTHETKCDPMCLPHFHVAFQRII